MGRQTDAIIVKPFVAGRTPGVAAQVKSGVASLRTFWCGMGVPKLGNCGEVCGHKIIHFHTIWSYAD